MESYQESTDSYPLSLREAVESKNYDYLREYLADRQNVYIRESDGSTLLQIALQMNDIEMVNFLLQHDADPNQSYLHGNWEGCTPLHFALTVRSSAMAILLIDYGAELFTSTRAVHIVIKFNRVQVMKYLLDFRISPDTLLSNNLSILTDAAKEGNIKMVRCILQHGPDVNLRQNQQALIELIQKSDDNSRKLVDMMYAYGFSLHPDSVDAGLAISAIINSHPTAVFNMLHVCENSDINIFANLDKSDAEVMLNYAVYSEKEEIVRVILNHGVDIHTTNTFGHSPILTAASKNNLSMIKLLLNHGADVTDTDPHGRTVLHLAIMENVDFEDSLNMDKVKTEIVELLIAEGADVNAKTTRRHANISVIHCAALAGIPGVIRVLLAHGARVNVVNSRDTTPLDFAKYQVEPLIAGMSVMSYPEGFRQLKLATLHLLQAHIQRLHRVGLPVCPKDLEQSSHEMCKMPDDVSQFIDDEIEFIKETIIPDCRITLFRFLTSSDDVAANLVRNATLVKNLNELLDNPSKFPEYSILINIKLTAALALDYLNKVSFEIIKSSVNQDFWLPDECIERTTNYLSQKDKEAITRNFIL